MEHDDLCFCVMCMPTPKPEADDDNASAITTEQLRHAIEQPVVVRHWGTDYTVTPRLIDDVFGDGLALLALYPIMERPNHYVVRVDSTWDKETIGDDNPNSIWEYLDDIYEAAEDQFGLACCGSCGERYGSKTSCEDCHGSDAAEGWFPAANFDDGSCWGELHWPQLEDRR